MRWFRAIPVVLLAVTSAGCGPELLGGAQTGEVRSEATSDDGARPYAGTSGASPSRAGSADADAAAQVQGEISLAAEISLVSDDGRLVPITSGLAEGSFRIEGDDRQLLGRAQVETGTYTGVRVAFSRVAAIVEGGLILNGVPLLGPVTVQISAGDRVVVERPIELVVERGESRTVVIDVNAQSWLLATSLPSRTVPAEIFRAAVAVHVR